MAGTWQKKGFSSMNSVVTVISADSGKCLDYQVLSKICHVCYWEKRQDSDSTTGTSIILAFFWFDGNCRVSGLLFVFGNCSGNDFLQSEKVLLMLQKRTEQCMVLVYFDFFIHALHKYDHIYI